MKRILILSGFLAICFSVFTQNTSVPNGGFENWNSTVYYENPKDYTTSNESYYYTGLVSVFKSTEAYHGINSLKVQTVATPQDTTIGVAVFGKKNALGNIIEGFPFTQKPTHFHGYVKYDCDINDPSAVDVIFKKAGVVLTYNTFYFKGAQTSFKEVSLPLQALAQNPDTVVIRFASSALSKKKSAKGVHAGNWLIFDYINFTGATTAIPNGDFEEWNQVLTEDPVNWSTLNNFYVLQDSLPYITKSRNFHTGNYATRIEARQIFARTDFITSAYITTGKFHIEKFTSQGKPDISGGFAIKNLPDSVQFWYKYDNTANPFDSALVMLELKKGDSTRRVYRFLGAEDNYKYASFYVPPITTFVPDSANLIISAIDYYVESNIMPGNILYVDDLSFHYPEPPHQLSGTVTYENNAGTLLTNNIKIVLKNSLNKKIDSTFTNNLGKYQFNNVPKGSYTFLVTTIKKAYLPKPSDALLVNRAFIGTYTFKTPFKRKVADVNNDTKVNSLDALTINRRFVGSITAFKIPDWMFDIPVIDMGSTDLIINFKGLCTGDVTGFYTPPL